MSRWNGWWEQRGLGRQEMRNLVLNIAPDGSVSGSGDDCIGPFTFSGRVAPEVMLVKQYVGRHTVLYAGTNSGEGLFGMWRIPGFDPFPESDTGRFALFPAQDCPAESIALQELKPAPSG